MALVYAYVFCILPYIVYTLWDIWLLRPLLLAILLPFAHAPFFLICLITCNLCWLLDGYIFDKYMQYARIIMARIFYLFQKIMHGYELIGSENIPKKGGALIVYYHGLLPLDAVFLSAHCFINNKTKSSNSMIGGVIDKALWKLPLIAPLFEAGGYTSADRNSLVKELKDGKIFTVAPGGSYECLLSNSYQLMWRNRKGFAHAAKEAGVPIIPMFTENIQEVASMLTLGKRDWIEKLYLKYRLPIILPVGGLPVKLRTYLGKPLYCRKKESADSFALRVKQSIEQLRDDHQCLGGNHISSLIDRLPFHKMSLTTKLHSFLTSITFTSSLFHNKHV